MANTKKSSKITRKQIVMKLPISLIEKIRNKAEEDNLNNTAVIINALNFYFEQYETIKMIPKLIDIYQQDSKLKRMK